MNKAARIAFGRRFGASPEARERIAKADAEALWFAVCTKCKTKYKGTLTDIRAGTAHICGVSGGEPSS